MFSKFQFCVVLIATIVQGTLGQECNQYGQCTKAQISQLVTAKDGLDCLKKCQNSDDCKWFTYQSREDDYNCELLRTCEQVENQCSRCLSGQSLCPSEFCWIKGMCIVSLMIFLKIFKMMCFIFMIFRV